jgi:hypothetical protein
MASRPPEEEALSEFLDSASTAPSALLLDGEAGIGKTTVWLAGLKRARDRGFRVLSARVANAESVLAYAPLADLLTGVDPDMWADLPDPQRIALDRLLREHAADVANFDLKKSGRGSGPMVKQVGSSRPGPETSTSTWPGYRAGCGP